MSHTGQLDGFPGGKLYFWDGRNIGYLNLGDIPYQIYFQDFDLADVIHLGYSQASNQAAIVTGEDGIELWISDLALNHQSLVWTDKAKWLGDIGGYGEFDLYWGPNDQYIVIESGIDDQRILVYSLVDGEAKQFIGNCSSISQVLTTGRYEIICFDEPNNQYFAMSWSDGFINLEQQEKVISNDVVDWVYSNNGEMILYTDSDGDVNVVDQTGQITSMDINSEMFIDRYLMVKPKWSPDNRNVLIFGSDKRGSCPKRKSTLTDSIVEAPCWLVFDTITGEIVWKPDAKISDLINQPLEYIHGYRDATFSPDGKWINIPLTGIISDYSIFASLEGNQLVAVNRGVWDQLYVLWIE